MIKPNSKIVSLMSRRKKAASKAKAEPEIEQEQSRELIEKTRSERTVVSADSLPTIISNKSRRLAKLMTILPNDTWEGIPYALVKSYKMVSEGPTENTCMVPLVEKLQYYSSKAVVMGEPKPGRWNNHIKTMRRLKVRNTADDDEIVTITDRLVSWLPVDIDNVRCPGGKQNRDITRGELESTVAKVLDEAGIGGSSHIISLSGSHGKPGTSMLKARVWIRLEEPVALSQLQTWVKGINRRAERSKLVDKKQKYLDQSIYTPHQLIYTAVPMFKKHGAGTIQDPFFGNRIHVVRGETECAHIESRAMKRVSAPSGRQASGLPPEHDPRIIVPTIDLLAAVQSAGIYLGEQSDFIHNIECPWEHEHGSKTAESSTVIIHNADGTWGFNCMHNSCYDRNTGHFKTWLHKNGHIGGEELCSEFAEFAGQEEQPTDTQETQRPNEPEPTPDTPPPRKDCADTKAKQVRALYPDTLDVISEDDIYGFPGTFIVSVDDEERTALKEHYRNAEHMLNLYGFGFSYDEAMNRPIVYRDGKEKNITTHLSTELISVFKNAKTQYGAKIIPIPGNALFHAYLDQMMEENTFNPIQDYLFGGGLPKLEKGRDPVREMMQFIDTENPEESYMAMRKFFIAAVAAADNLQRFPISEDHNGNAIMNKFENVLVLVGGQGAGKSSFIRDMVPKKLRKYQASGVVLALEQKDCIIDVTGKWVVELGELGQTFKKTDQDRLKGFLSMEEDTYRTPFAKRSMTLPRKTVFLASINERDFLRDKSGSRRYWPVYIKSMDDKSINRYVNVDELWAKAVEWYTSGEVWWLDEEYEKRMEDIRAEFQVQDPLQEDTCALFDFDGGCTDTEVKHSVTDICRLLGIDPSEPKNSGVRIKLGKIIGAMADKSSNPVERAGKVNGRNMYYMPPLLEERLSDFDNDIEDLLY